LYFLFAQKALAIYLVLLSPISFSGPPLSIGRAILWRWYTWPYNP